MKIQAKLAETLAVLLIVSNVFPLFMAKADSIPKNTILPQNHASPADAAPVQKPDENFDMKPDSPVDSAPVQKPDSGIALETDPTFDSVLAQKPDSNINQETDLPPNSALTQNPDSIYDKNIASPADADPAEKPDKDKEEQPDILPSASTPEFHADIQYSFQGYMVIGHFTEFLPDLTLAEPWYSLDGENYQICGNAWNLRPLNTENPETLVLLQNQICLYSNQEPLKSYLAGKLDCFYLKLRLTRDNGSTYETLAAIIDRGSPKPVPEEFHLIPKFSSSMRVFERNPFRCYGKYQLTLSENATPEEVASYLPDTLPIEIELQKGIQHFTSCTVDCPVTWKPLSLPRLTAGESVTIPDAAWEITVPAGTLLNTPLGIFHLENPLDVEQYQERISDEVQLVLNVIPPNADPTGVLSQGNYGLEMAFDLKTTGATEIQAYVLSYGEADWTPLPDLPLLEAINSQPSTANSGYAFVLYNDWEPYQSYLKEKNAGNDPNPFFVGLKIKGGVYNDRQLILPWPGTYDIPVELPKLNGSGGNENNAGSDNKNDSTDEGQRPVLPQNPQDKPNEQQPALPQNPQDKPNEQQPALPQNPQNKPHEQQPTLPQNPQNKPHEQQPTLPQNPQHKPDEQQPTLPQNPQQKPDEQQPALPQNPQHKPDEQQPTLPQNPQDKPNNQQPSHSQKPQNKPDNQQPVLSQKQQNKPSEPIPALLQNSQNPQDKSGEQQPIFPQNLQSKPEGQQLSIPQKQQNKPDKQMSVLPQKPQSLLENSVSQPPVLPQKSLNTSGKQQSALLLKPLDVLKKQSLYFMGNQQKKAEDRHSDIQENLQEKSNQPQSDPLLNSQNNMDFPRPDRSRKTNGRRFFLIFAAAAASIAASSNWKMTAGIYRRIRKKLRFLFEWSTRKLSNLFKSH